MKNSRGVTLVGVLVATVLIGIIAAVLASIAGTTTAFMSRSNTESDIDQATQYIYGLLAVKSTCDQALLDSTGNLVKWNYNTQTQGPVSKIRIPGSPATIITVPQQFGQTTLTGMYLREPDPTKGEPAKVESTILKGNTTYYTVSARLVLQFSTPNNMSGGLLQERYVDLTLALNQSNYQIAFCYPQSDTTLQSYGCNSSSDLQGQPDCPAAPSSSYLTDPNATYSPGKCQKLYYVVGFQDSGTPICGCKWSCPPQIVIHQAK